MGNAAIGGLGVKRSERGARAVALGAQRGARLSGCEIAKAQEPGKRRVLHDVGGRVACAGPVACLALHRGKVGRAAWCLAGGVAGKAARLLSFAQARGCFGVS